MIGLFKKACSKSSYQLSAQNFEANPFRNCRGVTQLGKFESFRSHDLRPSRSIAYAIDENSRSTHYIESDDGKSDDSTQDEDFELSPRKRKARKAINKTKGKKAVGVRKARSKKDVFGVAGNTSTAESSLPIEDKDDRVYVIDYGLATKFIDTNGEHKPFCMDQRRAHDGTLEFTSRDAHFGAHSRRSDLECLGYNLIYWSGGFLPWKDERLKEQPEIVHRLKEVFMTDVKEISKLLYGKNFPRYLGDFMQNVSQLGFDEEPDYEFFKKLFEKEFVKLGYEKSEMKLDLNEMRDMCEPNNKTLTENELMLSTITDIKAARKLGFLIVTDSVDGIEPLLKPNDSINLNMSSKASPKNLRSKGKGNNKRPKRAPKPTEKELVSEKMAQGLKLSIAEIATLDPDQIARERADREYEKFDEKVYYQTPQRYSGNPTYAILEIENKLKSKQFGSVSATVATSSTEDIEPIKGYTKPMMDVLRRQQVNQEHSTPLTSCQPKRNALRHVIKPAVDKKSKEAKRKKLVAQKQEAPDVLEQPKRVRGRRAALAAPPAEPEETIQPTIEEVKKKRGRPKAAKVSTKTVPVSVSEVEPVEVEPPAKRKRGRPRVVKPVIEPAETEEDSVYYVIPGEGSNDGVKEISEDENEPIVVPAQSFRSNTEENSNQASTSNDSIQSKKKTQRSYYVDDDYDVSTDETTNMSSATNVTASSFDPRLARRTTSRSDGRSTTTKTKSRSTSRSVALTAPSDQSECETVDEKDSEYNGQSDYDLSDLDEDENISNESEIAESSSNDSIDIKYSPIKTRHARRRVSHFTMKQPRGESTIWKVAINFYSLLNLLGRRIIVEDNTRNFRLVSVSQG